MESLEGSLLFGTALPVKNQAARGPMNEVARLICPLILAQQKSASSDAAETYEFSPQKSYPFISAAAYAHGSLANKERIAASWAWARLPSPSPLAAGTVIVTLA
jgi:hypothetical protein